MDEGSGTQIADSSGSGSSGNLINMDNANWVVSPILGNNAPTDITLSSNSFNENIASAATIATLSATDPDSGNTHTFSLTSSGDDRDDEDNLSGCIQTLPIP